MYNYELELDSVAVTQEDAENFLKQRAKKQLRKDRKNQHNINQSKRAASRR